MTVLSYEIRGILLYEVLPFGKSLFVIGEACDIIKAHVIECRELSRKVKWNGVLALLIIGLGGFMHLRFIYKLFLCKILVLTQITNSAVKCQCYHSEFCIL